jgi:DNA-binding MarR family transcriptional regulator
MTIWKVWQRKHRDDEAAGAGVAGASEPAQQISRGKRERPRVTHRGRTLRAFRAYLDLLETTAYVQKEMQSQLEAFDVTMRTIRILEMLYRRGPMAMRVMARQMKCSRQNIKNILRPLRERDWVVLEMGARPPVPKDESRLPAEKRGDKRRGRAIGIVRLTPRGKHFIGTFFPKHAKVVKSLMRVLDGREQVTLSRLLLKLRKGDVVKFVQEIRMFDDEDWERVRMDQSGYR